MISINLMNIWRLLKPCILVEEDRKLQKDRIRVNKKQKKMKLLYLP